MITITLLSALDKQRAIGFRGSQPFYIPADLLRFKALTTGHTVIMGRRTFEALPHGPLPHRRNIVLSRSVGYAPCGVEVFASLPAALAACSGEDEVFIIGGGEIYAQALPLANRLCLTQIDTCAEAADTFFPDFDKAVWREVFVEHHPADSTGAPAFTFVDYCRVR